MEHKSDRPARKRLLYNTMELCFNKEGGPHGCLELIVSRMDLAYPTYYYWPVGADKTITAAQLEDLTAVVGREISDTVMTRVNVQAEIPGLLSP